VRRWLKYLPSIIVYRDLPANQETGAYATYSAGNQTISLYNQSSPLTLLHELGHHVIHLLGGGDEEHMRYDAASWNVPVEWMEHHYREDGILEREP